MLLAGNGVQDDKARAVDVDVEEDAAMAAVEDAPAGEIVERLPGERGGCHSEDEDWHESWPVTDSVDVVFVEETQQWRRSVEGAVMAAEGGVGEEAAPALTDHGGAREGCGVVRREAEEDLLEELGHQLRRLRHGAVVSAAGEAGRSGIQEQRGGQVTTVA